MKIVRRGLRLVLMSVGLAMSATPAFAEIVFSQSPNQSGGFVSDTDQTFLGHPHVWEWNAEDFHLDEPREITQVVFWGFYATAIFGPPDETMRIRFYMARESDGLPDEGAIVHEQTVQNPHREETGDVIHSTGNFPEYRYTINLSSPVAIEADTTYWFEAIQEGDPDSDFFWESARTTTPQDRFAFINISTQQWGYVGPRAGLAFQLLTPEPHAFGLIAIVFLLFPRRCGRREKLARSG